MGFLYSYSYKQFFVHILRCNLGNTAQRQHTKLCGITWVAHVYGDETRREAETEFKVLIELGVCSFAPRLGHNFRRRNALL